MTNDLIIEAMRRALALYEQDPKDGEQFTNMAQAAFAVVSDRIEALTAEVERLRGALEQIAKADYGYMDIIESGAPPEKHADYFCSMVNWRRMTARAALAGDSYDQ